MTDLDTRIKDLVNSAVDAELAGHRVAPTFEPRGLADRSEPVGGLRQWGIPVLAAMVAAVLCIGVMVGITHSWRHKARQNLKPALPSPSRSTSLPPLYLPEAKGAPEAEDVSGVTIGPVAPEDVAVYQQLGSYWSPEIVDYPSSDPKPGEPLFFSVKYIVGQEDPEVSLLSWKFRDVTTGDCPGPFLVRPAHTYLLHCQAVLRPDTDGQLEVSYRSTHQEGGVVLVLTCNECLRARNQAAKERAAARFAQSTAGVPEATEVAGVSVGPASTESPGYTGPSEPFSGLPGATAVPGKNYSFTVEYVVASDGEPVAALSVELGDVTSGSCPDGPFLIRAGHTYRISCQVTFRTATAGVLQLTNLSPSGKQTETVPLIEHGS